MIQALHHIEFRHLSVAIHILRFLPKVLSPLLASVAREVYTLG